MRVRDAMKCAACNFDQVLLHLSLISSHFPSLSLSHSAHIACRHFEAHSKRCRLPSATVRTQQSGHRVNQLTLEHFQRGHGQGQPAALPDTLVLLLLLLVGNATNALPGGPSQAGATAAALAFLALHSVTLGLTQRVGQR